MILFCYNGYCPSKFNNLIMQNVARLSKRFFSSYKALPQKKQYLEFFTALLSIPVLVTVIILNFNSLKNINNPKTTQTNTPIQTTEKIYYVTPGNNNSGATVITSTPQASSNGTQSPCKADIGPVSIDSPQEGTKVSDNPVSVNISYSDSSFCAVVWSYRINGGQWSDYDNKSIAIYNPPQGNIKLDLQVKSIVNGNSKTLTRNFTYIGSASNVTPVPSQNQTTQNSSTSASLH
jgi:hypothetical protein